MKILFGIIFLHLLVILISRTTKKEKTPYFTALLISLITTGYVLVMLFTMEMPEP